MRKLIKGLICYSNVTVTMARSQIHLKQPSEEIESRVNQLAEEKARQMFESHRIRFEDSLIYEKFQDRIQLLAEKLAEEKLASMNRREN